MKEEKKGYRQRSTHRSEHGAPQLQFISMQWFLARFLGGTVNYSSCPYKAIITVATNIELDIRSEMCLPAACG